MQWVSLAIITLFGGATLIFHDETFIKWKPSILYWLMGSALVVGQLGFKKNFIQSMMSAQLSLPDFVWLRLLWSWSGFFAIMGGINLWVAFNYDTDTWVNYKLFGSMGLMFVFVLAQGVYLSRFIQPEADQPTQEP
jgi:intracellular septation protein